MTGQERAEIIAGQEELRGDIRTLEAKVSGSIDTLTARLNAHLEKTSAETKTLFASRREQTEKIHAIEVDYVPRHQFSLHQAENREDHKSFADLIGKAQWRLAMISGGISLGAFLAGLAVKAVFP
ncbi:MAG: hypothetical protein KF841_14225 [Phycisphaerae bacterium]|nr:hypothetical protein [Phycisphaerae bacterium]